MGSDEYLTSDEGISVFFSSVHSVVFKSESQYVRGMALKIRCTASEEVVTGDGGGDMEGEMGGGGGCRHRMK